MKTLSSMKPSKDSCIICGIPGVIIAMFISAFMLLFSAQLLRPCPTDTIRREFSLSSQWINNYKSEYGILPSVDEFRRFSLRENMVIALEYEMTGPSEFLLRGWDGNYRWEISSSGDEVVLVR